MASALLTSHTFSSIFQHKSSLPLIPFSSFAVSSESTGNHVVVKLRNHHPKASSSEGNPVELIEDSKFVPLNADDPSYGPPTLLLLGFDYNEAGKIQRLLKEMDGEFLEVIYCTEDMINRPLCEVMAVKQKILEASKIAKSLPRICFLSGLSGEDMTMFIDAFSETGLEPAVFAAMVPNSADKPIQELIDEIMGDHEMLSAKQSSST